jgi:hypothetical protein
MTQSTEAKMFDTHAYLRDEFHRYFPDTTIHIRLVDEMWTVIVVWPGKAAMLTLTMTIGSDDDCFRFMSDNGFVYTVPFSSEMGV